MEVGMGEVLMRWFPAHEAYHLSVFKVQQTFQKIGFLVLENHPILEPKMIVQYFYSWICLNIIYIYTPKELVV